VKLVLNNGRTYEKRILDVKGSPANPMTREEVETSFTRLAGSVLSAAKVEQVVLSLRDLAHVKDVSEISRLLIA